jgi:indolepyruvate ferredoxin oxidoreductase, alpha subunit
MPHPLLAAPAGSVHFLLGNEAIVRGALEAGVGCVTCYPGTPSSEVPDTFFRLSPDADYFFEYSINEKVALEVGGGAALAGVPTLVTMKHVGVNVAADPLMTLAYIGTPGGLVLLSADDPGCHSSQNEQDNRYYARLAGLPCFEPTSVQEAKDMTREALALSAKWEMPVMLRTTTRLNHMRGSVVFGELVPAKTKGHFQRDPRRFVPVPANARGRHAVLLENLARFESELGSSPYNPVSGSGSVGVIASGISRAYLRDAVEEHGLSDRLRILELGLSYPFPARLIEEFLQGLDKVMVVEELEPIIETEVRNAAHRAGNTLPVIGKSGLLPRHGEFSSSIVAKALCSILEIDEPKTLSCPPEQELPARPPNLCAGCPHRAAYFAVRKVFGDDAVYSSDIGCYTLGILPPLQMADFLLCMGSAVSSGTGAARAGDQPVVAFIGDSTFFHSGITGLINAVANRHDILLVILDNRTTAMTGHQPHPGVEHTLLGPNPSPIDLEAVIRGCGVEQVRKVHPLNLKKTSAALEELKGMSGVRVLIAEDPCPLFAKRALSKAYPQVAYVSESCQGRRECLEKLACPAFLVEDDGKVRINAHLCSGCMFCLQVCRHIKARKRS